MDKIKEFKIIAKKIRIDIIKMLALAGSGHTAGSLGITDILTVLYFSVLRHDPKNPYWKDRDRFLLSAGHLCPALYTTLAHAGYFPKEELLTLRALASQLQGHSHRASPKGVEIEAGSLGQGLSVAAGAATAAKLDKKNHKVICLTSDGEHDEGQIWEAAMFSAKYKLNNLINIIDRNHIQIDGTTEEIMPIEPLALKYQSFGWQVLEVDGHNFQQLKLAFQKAYQPKRKPTVIIAHTISGKGVSFMEKKWGWHGIAPTAQEAEKAIRELEISD